MPEVIAGSEAGAQFAALLIDIWNDLHQPVVLWQILTLLLCLVVGWYGSAALLRHVHGTEHEEGGENLDRPGAARRFGEEWLKRVAFPLLALVLVVSARWVLARFHNVSLLDLAVPLLMSMVVIRLAVFIVRQVFGRRSWIGSFERAFAALAWLVVALHVVGWLPEVIDALESVSFAIGPESLSLWMLLQGTAMVLLSMLLALWAGGLVDRRLDRSANMDLNLRVVLSRVVKALLLLLAFLITLPLVGINLTTLSVFGGAFGVGLGLGMQKIAANYVSGFILLLERSLRIGNLITVGSERGVVKEINTRYTVLRAANGVESIIPNDTLIGSVVQNETFTDSRVSTALEFQIAYGADVERAMQILVETAQANSAVIQRPAPAAYLVGFGDNGINLRLVCWLPDPRDGILGPSSAINLRVWQRFRDEGIEFPFPQREVRILPSSAALVAAAAPETGPTPAARS